MKILTLPDSTTYSDSARRAFLEDQLARFEAHRCAAARSREIAVLHRLEERYPLQLSEHGVLHRTPW